MKKTLLLFLLFSVLVLSCSYPSRLEQALQFSNENHQELEKVLTHYSTNPADSLKYRAAFFLIENMPYHYSYHGNEIILFKKKYEQLKSEGWVGHEAVNEIEKRGIRIDLSRLSKVYDSHVITADYLIKNIEYAFMVWETQPWGNDVSFPDFKKYNTINMIMYIGTNNE